MNENHELAEHSPSNYTLDTEEILAVITVLVLAGAFLWWILRGNNNPDISSVLPLPEISTPYSNDRYTEQVINAQDSSDRRDFKNQYQSNEPSTAYTPLQQLNQAEENTRHQRRKSNDIEFTETPELQLSQPVQEPLPAVEPLNKFSTQLKKPIAEVALPEKKPIIPAQKSPDLAIKPPAEQPSIKRTVISESTQTGKVVIPEPIKTKPIKSLTKPTTAINKPRKDTSRKPSKTTYPVSRHPILMPPTIESIKPQRGAILQLAGTGTPNSQLLLEINNNQIRSVTSNNDGRWRDSKCLVPGIEYKVKVSQMGANGMSINESPYTIIGRKSLPGNGAKNIKDYYQVKKGDTITELARRFRSSVEEISRVNNLNDANKIYVCELLDIPNYPANQ